MTFSKAMMTKHFNTVVLGGGCLGSACAFSISRQLGREKNKVAIIEKKVLGAGLSSRHSAIVRCANASALAARLAKIVRRYSVQSQRLRCSKSNPNMSRVALGFVITYPKLRLPDYTLLHRGY